MDELIPEQPMEIETNSSENRLGSRVLTTYSENIQEQIIVLDYDERSRSPILTQRSTVSNRQTPPPDINVSFELIPLTNGAGNATSNVPESEPEINVTLELIPCANSADVPKSVPETEPDKCECTCKQEKKEKTSAEDYEDDEGNLCPICFDIWATSGEHRVCALKCGHLFGFSCLERWLKSQRTCPTCKRSVRKSDIRYIYAKKLIALDTSELTAVKEELEREKCERNKVQIELIQSNQRGELFQKELVELKRHVELLKTTSRYTNSAQSISITSGLKIYKEKYYEVNKDGGCRVMDYYKSSNMLVVSSQSPNPIFHGFGIRKLPINDFKTSCYIPLHSAVIRDLSFHPQRELLLSVSVDKCVRLTETANSKSVHTVQCMGPIWSCCWDATNPNYFYVGEQSGSAVKYDIRKASERLCTLQIPGDYSPVVALASAGWCPGAALPQGGLFVCKLNSCSVFAETLNSGEYTMHPLGLEGPFVSMRYDNITNHLLVTCRPNTQHPFTRHTLCTITRNNENVIVPSIIQVFQGSRVQKLLSRSCQMNIAGDVLVSAHQETNKVVDVWSVSNGRKINTLPSYTPVTDLCPVVTDSAHYLCALNEKKVDFFKLELS